jgi:hypothetical protein
LVVCFEFRFSFRPSSRILFDRSIGFEHELMLQDFFYNRNIKIYTELEMREVKHKTPDILLKGVFIGSLKCNFL